MLKGYVLTILAVACCAWPLTVRAATGCAHSGQICGTLSNPSNPDCCIEEGLICGDNARCILGQATTTLPGEMSSPVVVTPQDLSLKVNGGADYSVLNGYATDQYGRDMMEQTLLGQWTPRVVRFMESLPRCAQYVKAAWTQLSTILQRLDCVHQYDFILGRKVWNVTVGGRHYQIEYYIDDHAHDCALADPAACARSPLLTPDLADLLDLSVMDGQCVDGAAFEPVPRPDNPVGTLDGIADGRKRFPVTEADDLALLQATVDAHAGGMCGGTPAGSVSEAQLRFASAASSRAEMHYRQPQPFIGGCDPAWTADQCCQWKMLEHREYLAWAAAVKGGDWGIVRCFGGRHRRVHFCANLYGPYTIRMPPCDGSYPDDTDAVTCAAYLADPTP